MHLRHYFILSIISAQLYYVCTVVCCSISSSYHINPKLFVRA